MVQHIMFMDIITAPQTQTLLIKEETKSTQQISQNLENTV